MASCARCGADGAVPPQMNIYQNYEYCDDCQKRFRSVMETGVVVRSRHSNQVFDQIPYVVSVNAPDVSSPHTANIHDPDRPLNQVEALAMAKKLMEKHSLQGVFLYQKTGSVWLIDEYLNAHPGIASDVEKENKGVLSKIFGRI